MRERDRCRRVGRNRASSERARCHRLAPSDGFTLVELVSVVFILGIFALVALPAAEPSQSFKLDRAASQVASAIRFARSEALRTGAPHGINVESTLARIRVFRGDVGTSPPTPVYDVRHPLTKHIYEVDLRDQPMTSAVAMNAAAVWTDVCTTPTLISFDGEAAPRCHDPAPVLLTNFAVSVSMAGVSRFVVLEGETGRVTVQ